MNKFRHSLRMEMLFAILLSALIAIGLFFVNQKVGYVLIYKYFEESDYIHNRNEKLMNEAENLIKKDNLSTKDGEKIIDWADNIRSIYVAVGLYKDGKNMLPNVGMDKGFFENSKYISMRNIEFSDGKATLYIYGYFDYQAETAAMIVEIILSVIIFFIIFLALLQYRISYILQLEKEIKMLETGGLDHEITVKGKDELASLASDLNKMRIALKENIEKEAEAMQANYNLVVGVAHDVRTPLTALLLYLDLLKKSGEFQPKQIEYIDKSRRKAAQIKKMTDDLFERFLISGRSEIELEPPQKAQFLLEDVLSDLVASLGDNGIESECDVNWSDCVISVSTDYINRIIDNIGSNILKYADRAKPITLNVFKKGNELCIHFENYIMKTEGKMESTKVGVKNITMMMSKMNGRAKSTADLDKYIIELYFPVYK